jgi:RND family efflux transporter MFP subunit
MFIANRYIGYPSRDPEAGDEDGKTRFFYVSKIRWIAPTMNDFLVIPLTKGASTLLLCLWIWTSAFGLEDSRAAEIEAITLPSADITMSFVMSGRLAEVLVKEGDSVKNGQILAVLEDRVERLKVIQLKAQVENKTRIKAAEADLEQKKIDLKKFELARRRGAATDWEVDHARLGLQMAELSLRAVLIEHEQDLRRYEQAIGELERMRLVCPIKGCVEKVLCEVGEGTKPLEPVIQVVRIDPMWIDVQVPLTQAKALALNQDTWITFPFVDGAPPANGRIIHISGVADAASDTLRVRIEVPNASGRPAGERVTVRFSKKDQEG